jgi:hypothetical protein
MRFRAVWEQQAVQQKFHPTTTTTQDRLEVVVVVDPTPEPEMSTSIPVPPAVLAEELE